MKFKLLSLSLFSLSAVSPLMIPSFTHPAMAGCVAVDVGTQVAVDGNRTGHQTNHTTQNFGPNCSNSRGGTVTTVGHQSCVSANCQQNRTSSQLVDGDGNPIGVKTPNIGIQVHTPVHVYNPAEDPNWILNKRKQK